MDESHAAMAFDNFKILETMPAFRALAESGSKDPVDVSPATRLTLRPTPVKLPYAEWFRASGEQSI